MYNSIAGQLRVPEPVKQLGKIAKETPLLTYKEEQDLFLRYRKYGDRKSYEKIFRSHIRLVNKIARLLFASHRFSIIVESLFIKFRFICSIGFGEGRLSVAGSLYRPWQIVFSRLSHNESQCWWEL